MQKDETVIEITKVTYNCKFCGEITIEERKEWKPAKTEFDVKSCQVCSVSVNVKKGTMVIYGAYNRPGINTYAEDRQLKRDAQYKVDKVKRWQHGAYLYVSGINYGFNIMAFTPIDFKKGDNK